MDEKNAVDGFENESPGTAAIMPSIKLPYENIKLSPSQIKAVNENSRKDSFSPNITPNLRKDSFFPSPLMLPNPGNQINLLRSSFSGPPMNTKSAFYEVNDKNEGDSPKRTRGVSIFKKKEFWKKSASKNKNKLENKAALYLSKVLRKLRGLVRLRLNLAGSLYILIKKNDFFDF